MTSGFKRETSQFCVLSCVFPENFCVSLNLCVSLWGPLPCSVCTGRDATVAGSAIAMVAS
ncbi:Uncharacterised protein [Cutibacterium granulosum]|uniref:Uncharacterized protein n=1 Tax=Cutibacterium granulosum TaxID=33011 RepID=A0A239WA26_9ACTN|nr:Uncharacterised protein [Cutibacterium granulosum]